MKLKFDTATSKTRISFEMNLTKDMQDFHTESAKYDWEKLKES